MSKKKEFDCLKMKQEIQQQIYAEIKNMNDRELTKYLQSGYEEGPFADKVKQTRSQPAKTRRKTG